MGASSSTVLPQCCHWEEDGEQNSAFLFCFGYWQQQQLSIDSASHRTVANHTFFHTHTSLSRQIVVSLLHFSLSCHLSLPSLLLLLLLHLLLHFTCYRWTNELKRWLKFRQWPVLYFTINTAHQQQRQQRPAKDQKQCQSWHCRWSTDHTHTLLKVFRTFAYTITISSSFCSFTLFTTTTSTTSTTKKYFLPCFVFLITSNSIGALETHCTHCHMLWAHRRQHMFEQWKLAKQCVHSFSFRRRPFSLSLSLSLSLCFSPAFLPFLPLSISITLHCTVNWFTCSIGAIWRAMRLSQLSQREDVVVPMTLLLLFCRCSFAVHFGARRQKNTD